jgi:hypothetical protein
MPEVQNPGLGAGQVALLSKTVNLTAADIIALSTVPFQLLPPPGAGRLNLPLFVTLVYGFGTRPYFVAGGGLDQLSALYEPSADDTFTGVSGLLTTASSMFHCAPLSTNPYAILPGDDNSAVSLVAINSYEAGPIAAATLNAGGAGYAPNDTGTITTGTGDATYKVLTVGGGGAVLTFQVTSGGTAYAVANNRATATGGAQPGVGAGFIVNITAVQSGDGTLKVVTYYQIIPVP